jgi:signal transduction histidine kinase
MTELWLTCRLDPEPVQVGRAREQVRKVLPGWGLAEHDDLLQLIVSELVTNALRHCDAPIQVSMSYNGNDLRIEVWDDSDQMPVSQNPGHHDETGRGLQLVDGLISMYGGLRGTARQPARPGKTVYVSIPLQPGKPRGRLPRHSDLGLARADRARSRPVPAGQSARNQVQDTAGRSGSCWVLVASRL